MNRFLRKGAERGARDLTVGYSIGTADPSTFSEIEAALNHQQERRHHLAEEGYQSILVKDPDNRDALYLYGTLKLLYGDHEEAVMLLKRSVAVDPSFGEAWSAYGSALTALGQHEEAIMVFHRALDSSPKLADAHYHLARLHKAMREWDNAIMHFRNAIGLDRTHSHAYGEMAECYLELGEYDEAMAACHSAIMLDKRLVKAYNTLGRSLNGLGQTKAAEETFRTAIKLDPSFAEAYSNLGAAFLSLGRPAEALEACIQANQLNDNLAIAHCTRGESLRQLGRLDEAMQACQRAFTIDPESADGLNRLGTVYLESSMTDEAVVSFQKAFTVRHHNREAFSNYISALKCKHGASDEQILGAAKDFAGRFAFTDSVRPPKPTGIRRVGVLVGAVEDSPLGAALEALEDGCRQLGLEIAVYTNDAARGARVDRLSKKATVWRSVTGIDDETVRDLVRDDKVDVLVDMCGHSEGNRIGVLVNHAAPVQVTWLDPIPAPCDPAES